MLSTDPNIVLICDPRIAAVEVRENGERLVDLLRDGHVRVDESREFINNLSPNFSRLREGVLARLVTAQERLPSGIAFLVREGHRPLSVQQLLFNRYIAELRKLHRAHSEEQLFREACEFVAPPAFAPHSTGGAVDLTMIDTATGREVEMGSPFNGDPNDTQRAAYTASSGISASARKNRDIMCAALSSVGFANYPTEWWHWSFGDRYWAFTTKQSFAIYGSLEAG